MQRDNDPAPQYQVPPSNGNDTSNDTGDSTNSTLRELLDSVMFFRGPIKRWGISGAEEEQSVFGSEVDKNVVSLHLVDKNSVDEYWDDTSNDTGNSTNSSLSRQLDSLPGRLFFRGLVKRRRGSGDEQSVYFHSGVEKDVVLTSLLVEKNSVDEDFVGDDAPWYHFFCSFVLYYPLSENSPHFVHILPIFTNLPVLLWMS